MAEHRSFRRKSPRVVQPDPDLEIPVQPFAVPTAGPSPRRLLVVLAIVAGVLGTSSAWAYREVTRVPDPGRVPTDPTLIPDAAGEPVSEYFPRHTALYGRLSLEAGVIQMARAAMNGTHAGLGAAGSVLGRYVLPGFNVMAGSPGGTDEDPAAGTRALASDPVGRLFNELVSQLDRELAFGVFPNYTADQPVGMTVVAGLKDPDRVRSLLYEVRRQVPEAAVLDRIHLEGQRVWFSTSTLGYSGLARDGHFKVAMAHLPEDRFATTYLNAESLQALARATGMDPNQSGGLASAIPMLQDPELRSFLLDLEREGGTSQHAAIAATNRLGLVQTFQHSDWQPRDPVAFQRRLAGLLNRTMGSSLTQIRTLYEVAGS